MDDKKEITTQWLFIIIVMMMVAGLFVSRALLSISSVMMLVMFLLNTKSSPYIKYIVAGTSLIILPVIVSGLWSYNKHDWWRSVEIKIPLITIALGLASAHVTMRTWRMLSFTLIIFVTIGSIVSILYYISDPGIVLQNYLQAKVMATPLDDDHIRFSWLIVLCIILSCYLLKKPASNVQSTNQLINQSISQQILRAITILNIVWLIFYLHLLSAKTGLLCLYIATLIFAAHYILKKKKWLLGAGAVLAICVLPFAAYRVLPTFKNRVQYIKYDFNNYSKGNFISGLSDGARVLSLKAGWDVTHHHPLAGVGFGDMKPAIQQWHQQHHPHTLLSEQFLPLNEWLFYGTGSGVPGMICFTAGLLFLISLLWKGGSITDRTSVLVLLTTLVTDDTLETQFGVFIFIFMLMWLWLHKKLTQPAA